MSISHIQTAGIDGTVAAATQAVTLSTNLTAGDTIVVCVVSTTVGGPATFTVTDSLGNTYISTGGRAIIAHLAIYLVVEVFYTFGSTVGGPCTITVTPSASSTISMSAGEYTALAQDGVNTGTGASTSPSIPGGATFSFPPEMVIAVCGTLGNVGSITGTGGAWTERYNSGGVAGANDIETEDQLNISTAPTPSWTIGTSFYWGAVAASFYSTVTPTPPPTRQSCQQLSYDLPDFWIEYQAYRPVSFIEEFIPPRPTTFQGSQRTDPLSDFTALYWEQFRQQPIPISYVPTPPPLRQISQRIDQLPEFWVEHQAYRSISFIEEFIPPRPPTRQPSQRVDPLLDFSDHWYRLHATWPVPQSFMPVPPLPRQASQSLYFDLPQQDYYWYEQRRLQALPSPVTVFTSQEGVYGIAAYIILVGQAGIYRIQNNIEGYVAYVGAGVLPDLTQPPLVFGTSLPLTIPLTAPLSGTTTFYVLIRKQDSYGLQSQNQHYSTITIDQYGRVVMPPLAAPQNLKLNLLSGQMVNVLATYPTAATDIYPASAWKVWAGVVPPNPAVDVPVATVPVGGTILTTQIGPLTAGGNYVVVGLYRAGDMSLSPTISGVINVQSSPPEVIPVPGGLQQ